MINLPIFNNHFYMELSDPHTIFTLLVSKFRQTKRKTQNKLTQTLRTIVDMKKKEQNNEDSNQFEEKQKTLDRLSQVKKQLLLLKHEMSESFQEQNMLYGECRKRVHRDHTQTQPPNEKAQSDQFDRAVIGFFACRKKLQIAKTINEKRKSEVKNLELGLFEEAFKISNDIKNNKLRSLKQWCYDNSHSLARIKSSLEFKLACCEFLNLLNSQNKTKAIEFLRKTLNNIYTSEEDKKQLKKYTMLLVVQNQDENLLTNILKETNLTFFETFQKIYKISFSPKFDKTIGIGISVLKSICCQEEKNHDCPSCSQTIENIVQIIPMIARNQSSLKCRINGSLMGGNNYPVVMPDGNIYSLSGLESTGSETKFRCPKTGKSYKKQSCRKAFLS